jgi:hypothetical protein
MTRGVEPTAEDLDNVVEDLKKTWVSAITVRRQSKEDVGYRDIYVSIDGAEVAILHAGDEVTREVPPGRHQIKVHNTLFRKTVDLTLNVGEHAVFSAVNRAGFGTYSVFAFFLGGGPIYLSIHRVTDDRHG